jgi:lipoprotein LprG
MVMRRILLAVLAAATATAASCTSDSPPSTEPLPDGGALLRDAATAAKDIGSAHFTLSVNGEIPTITVHSAEGDLTRQGGPAGAAKGKVSMELFGNLFDGEFVVVNDRVYIKGPTGGFQQLPAVLLSNVYDPSAILDPQRGIANVLANVQNAKTEGVEDLSGTPTFRVSGRVSKDVVASIVPGVQSDVDITFWLRQDNKQPVRASVTVPGADGKTGTVVVTLSDVNKPVTITPPA